MTKKEKNALVKWAETLTDSQLLCVYYETVLESCDSQYEEMYEMGYDMSDVLQQEEYEKYVAEKARMLEGLCIQRCLKLWK